MKTESSWSLTEAFDWVTRVVNELRPSAPTPRFENQDAYRLAMATCVIHMGPEKCNPAKNPWANSILNLMKDFPWNAEQHRLLCNNGTCTVQTKTHTWESEGGFNLFAGCTPTRPVEKFEDVGSFGDVTTDMISQFNASTFFNYSPSCTKYSTTWMKLFDEDAIGEIVFAPAKGGGVLVAVNNTFTLIASDGNIVLKKKNEVSSAPSVIRYLAKDGYILGSRSQGSSAQNDKSLLSKISEVCDVLWNKDLDPNHSDEDIVSITQIAAQDGYFLNTEFRWNGSTNPYGNPKTSIVKRGSKNGEMIWETDIKEDFWTTYPAGLWVSKDGKINVLAGGVEDSTVARWIILSPSGKIESKKTFKNLIINAVVNTYDDGFVTVGRTNPSNGHLLKKHLWNGDEQWSVSLTNIAPTLFTDTALVQLNSDNIVVAGAQTVLSDSSSFSKIGLEIYSIDGKLFSTHIYNNQGISAALYAMPTLDGGIFLGGGIKTTNKSGLSFDKVLLVRTDANGDVCK